MNDWQNRYVAEYLHQEHRQRIVEEIRQIRLEKRVMKARVYRPGFFARSMFNFANWMISTGKELRQRYEIPAVKCGNTESFAR
jgi:hypothetical protein